MQENESYYYYISRLGQWFPRGMQAGIQMRGMDLQGFGISVEYETSTSVSRFSP